MGTTVKRKSATRGAKIARQENGTQIVEGTSSKPVWEMISEIGSQVPDEEWTNVPDDGSINYRHYLRAAHGKR